MKCFVLLLLISLINYSSGVAEDRHVEQVQSPYVLRIDPGTHMTNRNTRSQAFQGHPRDVDPYGTSSQHEYHEEQRYVNGQPVYEKRHERRYENGRLVHEDGHEKGSQNLGSDSYGTSGGHGAGGSSYRSSSSSRRESSTGLHGSQNSFEGLGSGSGTNLYGRAGRYGETGNSYGSTGSSYGMNTAEFENNFRTDAERLRQRLHQGPSIIRTPASTTSHHEERREQSHFVDGQQVYHKKEEQRFEDGRLVNDVSEELGPDELGATVGQGAAINTLHSQQGNSYASSGTQRQHSSNQQQTPDTHTSYRASYWRPGPQSRRVSTNSQRQDSRTSTANQPVIYRASPSSSNVDSVSRTPYQSSYRASNNRVRSETNKPAYRASYTPSRSVERVPQRTSDTVPVVSSQHSSSSTYQQSSSRRQQPALSTSSFPIGHQPSNSVNSGYQTPASSTPDISSGSNSFRQGYGSSSSNEHSSTSLSSSSYRPSAVTISTERTPTDTRRQLSTSYGTGSYIRPTESPIGSHTTSRITDSYSEPYSVRSASYQPSRFGSYSAWSHWKNDSAQPSHLYNARTSTTQSRYESNNLHGNHVDEQTASGRVQYPSTAESSPVVDQSRTVKTYRPGFIFGESDVNNYESYDSQRGGYEDSSSYNPSPSYRSESEQSSNLYSSSSSHSRDASLGTGSGGKVDMSITVNVGEGDSIRLGAIDTEQSSQDINQERYDISPLVDGGPDLHEVDNEIETEYEGRSNIPSSSVNGISSQYDSQYNSNTDTYGGTPSSYGQPGYTSGHRYESGDSAYNSLSTPVSGSTFGTTRITNRTMNSVTSHVQPLVSSYKLETRTSRRYLNGQLVSETKFNRYYENGKLVHENQTERSRDEMQTDGINVSLFDLSMQDLVNYGMVEDGSVPMSHSQRFEMRQEQEFVDGDQVYQSTHEKHYQDGELVHETHDEKNEDELAGGGRNIHTGSGISGQVSGGGAYRSNFNENQDVSSYGSGNYDEHARVGSRENSGIGETVTVSLSPRTRTHKTEIRQEQEYRDGEQIYDLHHERRFDDGNLVHENLLEKGPDELGTLDHRDALQDILSGRTLATASQSGYRQSSESASQSTQTVRPYSAQSYKFDGTVNTLRRGSDSHADRRTDNRVHSSENEYRPQSYQSGISNSPEFEPSQGQIGTNLLTSGCLTCVIGGGGVQSYDSLNNAPTLSTGGSSSAATSSNSASSYNSNDARRGSTGGGYYATVGRVGTDSGARDPGYGGGGSSISESSNSGSSSISGGSSSGGTSSGSRSNSGSSSFSSETTGFNSGSTGSSGSSLGSRYGATGSYDTRAGAYGSGQGITHRREMEVEEHYENGQLVSGREEDKEWKDGDLVKHDNRRYGEGDDRSSSRSSSSSSSSSSSNSGHSASRLSSPAHSSSYHTRSGGSSRDGVPSTAFGASANFDARSHGYGTAGAGDMGAGQGYTHRREMEMEEHYENGQLVRGREEDKEWNNDQLVKNEKRMYGEELASRGGSSHRTSPLSASSSSHQSSSSASSASSGVFQRSESGECSSRPCSNGGSCMDGTRGYLCVCTFGFRGPVCEEAYCPTRYCRHDGICQVAADGEHLCSCPVQYTGPRCEHRVRSRGNSGYRSSNRGN